SRLLTRRERVSMTRAMTDLSNALRKLRNPLWITLLYVASCQSAPLASSTHPADRLAIQQSAANYAAGFQSGEVDEFFAAVTEDFVAISPGKPALTGAPLREELERDLASMQIDSLTFELLETEVLGDTAWARGRSAATVQVGAERMELLGSFLWILRRVQGEWFIARDAATDDGLPERTL
ncbi:MAG: nuclear transport factor 2 family protein, partial [Planctomycetota bacterium]